MDRLADLLNRTSRTFALAIPLLPEKLREDVTLAYLLFRVADTLEDTTLHSTSHKQQALRRYVQLLESDRLDTLPDLLAPPISNNADDNELVDSLAMLMQTLQQRAPTIRLLITSHVVRSAEGMSRYLLPDSQLDAIRLKSLSQLRDYCYCVAGIVGEMLTDLFVARHPELQVAAGELQRRAASFGEGLQLVNILKDRQGDDVEGRHFIPPQVTRQSLFIIAREDLQAATEYVQLLRESRAPSGVQHFCELPLQLAWKTLDVVEAQGPGSKVSRTTVMQVMRQVLSQQTTVS